MCTQTKVTYLLCQCSYTNTALLCKIKRRRTYNYICVSNIISDIEYKYPCDKHKCCNNLRQDNVRCSVCLSTGIVVLK